MKPFDVSRSYKIPPHCFPLVDNELKQGLIVDGISAILLQCKTECATLLLYLRVCMLKSPVQILTTDLRARCARLGQYP